MSVGSSKVRLVEEFNVRLVWLGPEGERGVFEGEIKVDGGSRSTTVVVGPTAAGRWCTEWLRPATDGPSMSRAESGAKTRLEHSWIVDNVKKLLHIN